MDITLQPRLIVSSVDDAVAFYTQVFGAEETFRYTEPSGSVAHCELALGRSGVSMAEANEGYRLYAPQTFGGSPVLIKVFVADPVGLSARMVAAGAEVIVPVEDHGYGRLKGRLADPFGHLWVPSQPA